MITSELVFRKQFVIMMTICLKAMVHFLDDHLMINLIPTLFQKKQKDEELTRKFEDGLLVTSQVLFLKPKFFPFHKSRGTPFKSDHFHTLAKENAHFNLILNLILKSKNCDRNK